MSYNLITLPNLGSTTADAPLTQQNIVDVEKYGDKYYIAVMNPRTNSNTTSICIFSSSTGDLINTSSWGNTPVFSAEFTAKYGHDIKMMSGSNELLLYYSIYDNRGVGYDHLVGIGCMTSSNGVNWDVDPGLFLTQMTASTPSFSYNGPEDGFANSIDLLKDTENNKIILAAGAFKDAPFTDTEYSGYGEIGSGSVYIFSASLDTPKDFVLVDKLINENSMTLTEGPAVIDSSAGLYGTSVSLNKINNQYQVYVSLPAAWNQYDGILTKRYLESIWYHYSNDGQNWSTNLPVAYSNPSYPKDTFIGFGGLKAVNFGNKTFLFYSEPGENIGLGSGYVSFTEQDGTWNLLETYTRSNKTKLLDGLTDNGQFTSYSNLKNGEIYRTFSIDALSTETGIYYAFGSARSKNLSGSLHFGFSTDGEVFQKDGEIEIEIGNSSRPLLGTSVVLASTSSAGEEIAACVYSDLYNINTKTIGKSIIFELDIESEKAKKAYKHAAIEPFFAPGIFYNTIKSGISVDWPSISGSTSYVPLITTSGSIPRNPFQPDSIVMSSFSGSGGIYNTRGSLRSKINYRIPFENILSPDEVFASKDMLDSNLIETYSTNTDLSDSEVTNFLDKTYIYGGYETFLNPLDINEIYTKNAKKFAVPFVYKDSKSSKNNSLFNKAMNNCLAEIPNFFLEQQKISVIESEPDYNWLPLSSGSTYYMDVVLEKNKDLIMMEAWHSDKHPTGSNGEKMNGRYFGYPVNKTTNVLLVSGSSFTEEEAKLIHNDPAYGPYTPPYFEGTAIARLSFVSKETKKYKLEEIFSNLQVEDIFVEASLGWKPGSDAELHKMKIGSSIELFDSILSTTSEVASTAGFTDPNMTTVKEEKDSKTWIIRPRIETPVLNFSNQSTTSYSKDILKKGGFGRGMWSGYGQIPNEGEGIRLRLEYPFDSEKQNQYSFGNKQNKYPLFDFIKFKNKQIDIGKVASQKQISEAIVLIPYIDRSDQILQYGTKKQYIEGINFIKINKDIYQKQKQNIRAGKNAVTIEDGVDNEIVETSISRMIKKSENYVIPPNLNFFKYEDIEPFVMYIFEFEHTLSQQDLSHIWQGVMPDISYNAELDEVSIEHEFTEHDLFNGSELPDDMKWLVFKVKRKAETKYDRMIKKSKLDYRFDIEIGSNDGKDDYGYNWPYDFFSLVELAKIEVEIKYSKGKTPPPLVGYTILE